MYHRHPLGIKLNKKLIAIILLCSSTIAWALDTDKYQPMYVDSHSATYDREQRILIYEGNVQTEQGSSHLKGDKVLVYQGENNQIKYIEIFGKPALYNTLLSPNKERLYVEAFKITYNPNDKTILLEGNGKVKQGNIFTGPHIWYDMKNGIVRSKPTKANERSVFILQPQKKAPALSPPQGELLNHAPIKNQ